MTKMLREPLFHFFVLAIAIFVWFVVLNPPDPTADAVGTIVIDEQDIERLSSQFEATWRRPPTAQEVQGLVNSLVRQEVLVREARALGLDRGDGVVRNRLAQKMEFLTTSVAQSIEPEEATLRAHQQAYPERFATPERVAFEQIPLSGASGPAALEAVKRALAQGADPASLGATSLLPEKLPLSSGSEVDRVFGRGFFDELAGIREGAWSGPVRSGYGDHLVRVTERVAAAQPPFETIRENVVFDWRRTMTEELSNARFEALKARYEIVVPGTSTPNGASDK